MFSTEQAGKVTLTVSNSIGQLVKTIAVDVNKGKQRIALNTDGLGSGMYIISVAQEGSEIARSRIIVK